MDESISGMESGSGLRLKSLSPTRRKDFFAHLKGAQQVHFANKMGEAGKCRVTSIHPSGAGHVQSKHDITIYTDEAFRLQRRLRKLARKFLVTGTMS